MIKGRGSEERQRLNDSVEPSKAFKEVNTEIRNGCCENRMCYFIRHYAADRDVRMEIIIGGLNI